jgi:hypothetical protein
MKKQLVALFLLLCVGGGAVFAQFVADPMDRLYAHITVWEEKGYVTRLPLLRPYPINLIEQVLTAVAEKGDPAEIAIARDYLAHLAAERDHAAPDKLLPSPFSVRLDTGFWSSFDNFSLDARPAIVLQGAYFGILSFSGFATMGFNLGEGDPAPSYTRISDDALSGGGKADIGGLVFNGRNLGLGVFTVGTEEVYLQAGLMRSSFGPFFDHGIIIGPQCPAAANISLTWRPGFMTLTSILLVAQPEYVEDETTGLRVGTDGHNKASYTTGPNLHTLSLEKYVALHTVTFYPFEWWTVGLIQTVVFGDRLNPAYLIPFEHLFFAQILYGDKDSSYIGLFSSVRLPLDLTFDFMFSLDDFNFNKFIGADGGLFDLNSSQNKFALQAGLAWTPRLEVLKRISFDYTMITPYTFTHNATSVVNYLSYTHMDSGIGSVLNPNSDQMYLSVWLEPASFLSVDLFSRLTRHGNPSEGYADGNGDYWDDGRDNTGAVRFFGPMEFLTQDVIEVIFQIGFKTEWRIGLGFGRLVLGAGYTFEYGWNRGLADGDNGARHIINLKAGLEL